MCAAPAVHCVVGQGFAGTGLRGAGASTEKEGMNDLLVSLDMADPRKIRAVNAACVVRLTVSRFRRPRQRPSPPDRPAGRRCIRWDAHAVLIGRSPAPGSAAGSRVRPERTRRPCRPGAAGAGRTRCPPRTARPRAAARDYSNPDWNSCNCAGVSCTTHSSSPWRGVVARKYRRSPTVLARNNS